MKRPDTLDLPDLSGLKAVLPWMAVTFGMTGAGPRGDNARRLVVHFTRSTDAALGQYDDARRVYGSLASGGDRLHAFIKGSEHLELCLVCLKRASLALHRLAAVRDDRLLDRQDRRLVGSYDAEITNLRDTIIHMDECIERGDIKEGQTVAVDVLEDGSGLEVGSYTITFDRLSALLTKLHQIAERLAVYKSTAEQTAAT